MGHPVGWSLCSAMPRHMGSVAFGALILAIVEFIKLIFDYIHAKMNVAAKNSAAGFVLKCIGCCLGCFERFI